MIRHEREGVSWLEFELLAEEKGVSQGVFLRHGGTSNEAYASLNFSYHVGDEPKHVKANVEKGKQVLGINTAVRGRLNHGGRVVRVEKSEEIPTGHFDGIVTSKPDLGLLITHADCQAAILYDPIERAAANIHCGWRGNIANIYANGVNAMKKHYGSKPENLLACVSPSLGPEHAEFIHYREEWPEKFWCYKVTDTHFDLWALAEDQLKECGILSHHIEIARQCTFSNSKDFFSYRKEKRSGRHGTFVKINSIA